MLNSIQNERSEMPEKCQTATFEPKEVNKQTEMKGATKCREIMQNDNISKLKIHPSNI